MKLKQAQKVRGLLLLALLVILTGLSNQIKADTGTCGGVTITLPFNDVMASPFFCQIAAAYYSGLTNGTTATTYSPTDTVTREQMAAFISRTLDQSLKRSSNRAVAKKWWTPQDANSLTLTEVGDFPRQVEFDGTDLWVANAQSNTVMRVRPSDGKVIETWTGAMNPLAILCALGKVFIVGGPDPGTLYMINPTQPAGTVTTLTTSIGLFSRTITFDGARLWIGNSGAIAVVTLNPVTVTPIVFLGSGSNISGMLYDGSSVWATDEFHNAIYRFNADGGIAQTVSTGSGPRNPVFDGTNIWVPNQGSSITVVRVKDAVGNPLPSAFVLAT